MCEWSVVLWKIPLRTPLGCGSGFGFFQSRAVPPDKDKKDSKRDWLQKQISGKIVPLVFWKFLFLISIMHLTPKWRQILLFFCLYNNWPSMPDFKVKIIWILHRCNRGKEFKTRGEPSVSNLIYKTRSANGFKKFWCCSINIWNNP